MSLRSKIRRSYKKEIVLWDRRSLQIRYAVFSLSLVLSIRYNIQIVLVHLQDTIVTLWAPCSLKHVMWRA